MSVCDTENILPCISQSIWLKECKFVIDVSLFVASLLGNVDQCFCVTDMVLSYNFHPSDWGWLPFPWLWNGGYELENSWTKPRIRGTLSRTRYAVQDEKSFHNLQFCIRWRHKFLWKMKRMIQIYMPQMMQHNEFLLGALASRLYCYLVNFPP